MRYLAFLLLLSALLFAGCTAEDEDVLHLGLNAEIVEIDAENHILYVSDTGNEGVFGGRCAIDCTELIQEENLIYVDYETDDIIFIDFDQLTEGDRLVINAYESELNDDSDNLLHVEQIQLGTQRL